MIPERDWHAYNEALEAGGARARLLCHRGVEAGADKGERREGRGALPLPGVLHQVPRLRKAPL
jgi:hypothetical protein